jgi:hypothetical protein
MIKLKQLLVENFYHVTTKRNLPKIKKLGLVPSIPVDMSSEEKAVYLFKDKLDAENAAMNWLGDRFGEEDLVLLTINSVGINSISSDVDYEVKSYNTISPDNILKIEYL